MTTWSQCAVAPPHNPQQQHGQSLSPRLRRKDRRDEPKSDQRLTRLLRPCFARTQAWQQAVEYTAVLAGDLPRRNGWTIAQYVGDRAPNRTRRLLNRAVWDGEEAMGLVRRFVVEGLSVATGRRRRGLVVGALDETGQQNVVCGDEVYGGCTQLREFLERHGQAYVLRVACTFMLELGDGARLTCRQAVARLLGQLPWEVRSAGAGSKGQRWYAWAGIATASPHHLLLVRRHLRTGDLAFHYCYLPDGRALGEPEDQAAMDQADAEVHDELAGEDG